LRDWNTIINMPEKTGKTNGNTEGKLRVLERVADVGHNVGLVNTDGKDLSLAVHTKNARVLRVRGGDKDRLSATRVNVACGCKEAQT
jgi:hypothetical protein